MPDRLQALLSVSLVQGPREAFTPPLAPHVFYGYNNLQEEKKYAVLSDDRTTERLSTCLSSSSR